MIVKKEVTPPFVSFRDRPDFLEAIVLLYISLVME